MMRKLEVVSITALLAALVAAPGFAGERRGDGGWTAIDWNEDVQAAICAFSGLEDFHESGSGSDPTNEDGSVSPGVTQTPHEVEGFNPPPGAASTCRWDNHGRNPKPRPEPPSE